MREKYPEAFHEGSKLAEVLYSRGLDREGAFNYASKCCRFRLEAEIDSYLKGFTDSYEWEEAHDISIISVDKTVNYE